MKSVTKTFFCGPTLQVSCDLIVKDDGQGKQQDVVVKFGEPIKKTVYDFIGVSKIQYNDAVGKDEPNWVTLEHGLDIGSRLREHKDMKTETRTLKAQITRLKNQLAGLGLDNED